MPLVSPRFVQQTIMGPECAYSALRFRMNKVVIRFATPPASRRSQPALETDTTAMHAELKRQLEELIVPQLGELAVRLEEGFSNDIRTEGKFPMKPGEVKRIVSEALEQVMDGFDSSLYV
jgi:hypothetical protein